MSCLASVLSWYASKQQRHFFWTFARFSPAAVGFFSLLWLRGTQEAHRYITTHAWIPAELCGTCSGRSKPLSLASNHGIAFRPARANQARANPKNVSKFFIFSPLMLFLKYHNSCERLGNQGTTAAALQAFPFVTATNGASKCGFMRVCACACVCLSVIVASYSSRKQDHSFRNKGANNIFLFFFILATVCCLLLLLCAYITP